MTNKSEKLCTLESFQQRSSETHTASVSPTCGSGSMGKEERCDAVKPTYLQEINRELKAQLCTFEKPLRQHPCKLLILKRQNLAIRGSEYICLLKAKRG
jgi:hypothetical protein